MRTAWTRPEEGTIKVNGDANLDEPTKTGGIGVITWDSEGQIIGGLNRWVGQQGAEMIEGMIILEGT